MTPHSAPPHTIAIAAHPRMPDAVELTDVIAGFLKKHGLQELHGSLYDLDLRQRVRGGEYDLLIALGGDGTMLRAGHLCAPPQIPILGINVGRFGFLTEVNHDHWEPVLERVLAGDFWLERRMTLRIEHHRETRLLGEWDALNECVVGRGGVVRPVRLTAEIDGRYLTTYVADALIVATATGSTAYALAAGGPILPPELRNILIIPVAPHLSLDRAIVLHEGSGVRTTVHTDHQASLSVDGQTPVDLLDGDQVEACAGEHSVHFVRLQDPGYFYRNLTSRMNQNPTAGAER